MADKLSFGITVSREMFYGNEYLIVRAMAREDGKETPLNCPSEPFGAWDDRVPKTYHGMSFSGLCIRAHVYSPSDREPELIGFDDCRFDNLYLATERDLLGAYKAAKRVNAAMNKAADALRENGGTQFTIAAAIRGFANGIGATWIALPESERYSSYSDTGWRFENISFAMSHATRLAWQMIEDEKARNRKAA